MTRDSAAFDFGPAGVAAVVNGETITVAELRERTAPTAAASTLQGMIEETLIDQAARARNIVVTDDEVNSKTRELEKSLGGVSLADTLKQHDMSVELFRDGVRRQIALEKFITAPIKPALHMRHVWHVTFGMLVMDPKTGKLKARTAEQARKLVQAAREKLKSGAKFEDVARRCADYAATKQNGGDLGILTEGGRYYANLFPPAKTLHRGEYTRQDIKSLAGYELIYVSSTAEDHPASEDAAYAQAARDDREEQQGAASAAILKTLRLNARIAIYYQPAGLSPVAAPEAAAVVNGQAITVDAVKERALKTAGPTMLSHMIESKLIDQEVRTKQISVTQAEIDRKESEIMARSGYPAVNDFLVHENLTPQQFDSDIGDQIKAERLVDIPVKPATHLRHVFHLAIATKEAGPLAGNAIPALPGAPPLPTKEEALTKLKMIRERLQGGAKFEDMAKEYSSDIFSRRNGGDLGILHDDSKVNREIVQVALGMKKGDYCAPFKSFFGYELVYVASTDEDHPATEEELYREARDAYRDSQIDAPIAQVLRSLEQKAQVSIYFHP
ncbi:hypothetical protein CCAX7_22060 [Capsulimonas corticalis]|uniref:peptidylprolyl isomerase n=1 Tax=Capsulimonas corticalis TaxID=2219043 RepID=A0A402D253_9BACT|nr:hypothetical protein CCAX7_22060 [Capsulimonas corticalis]